MAVAVAIIATLGFIAWFVAWAIKERGVRAHSVSYGVSIVAAIMTYAYFLSMDLPQLVKILVSIILGIVLIIGGALYARHLASKS